MQHISNIFVETFLTTVELMKRVLPSVYLGLFLASLSAGEKFSGKGRRWVPVVMRITGLSAASAISVLLSAGDRTAGMAALAAAQKQEGLPDREVIAANLIAKMPSVLQFFVFSFIPIMLSLYPRDIAVRFLTVYFAAFLVISAAGVAGARIIMPQQREFSAAVGPEARSFISWSLAVRKAVLQSWGAFVPVSFWMTGLSFIAMLLIKTGLLNSLSNYFPLAAYGVNANVVPAIGAGLISMLGGMAALGGAFREGAVSTSMVVPLLLATSLLHNCYDLFASSMPRTLAIFGKRLGIKVSLWSFGVTQAVMLIFILLTLQGLL